MIGDRHDRIPTGDGVGALAELVTFIFLDLKDLKRRLEALENLK